MVEVCPECGGYSVDYDPNMGIKRCYWVKCLYIEKDKIKMIKMVKKEWNLYDDEIEDVWGGINVIFRCPVCKTSVVLGDDSGSEKCECPKTYTLISNAKVKEKD